MCLKANGITCRSDAQCTIIYRVFANHTSGDHIWKFWNFSFLKNSRFITTAIWLLDSITWETFFWKYIQSNSFWWTRPKICDWFIYWLRNNLLVKINSESKFMLLIFIDIRNRIQMYFHSIIPWWVKVLRITEILELFDCKMKIEKIEKMKLDDWQLWFTVW